MAISGTHATGDMVTYKTQKVGLDINASGTYADASTWFYEVSIDRGTAQALEQKSFGNTSETAVSDTPSVTIVLRGFHTGGATDPYWNLVQLHEGTSKVCNVKLSLNSLTTPTTGDFTWTLTAGKITGITDPPMVRNTEAQISDFTATFVGTLTTTQA